MAVHVVVDSTSDIDHERAQQSDITVVPLTVSFGDENFRDGVDLDNKAFYEKLAKSPVLPKTSTPSVTAFEEAYRAAIKNGATGILSIHLTGALSGTLNAATLAAENLRQEALNKNKVPVPISLIDSRTVSAGFGMPAVVAARRAASGESLETLTAYVQGLFDRSHNYFVLDTLEYLEKGGRIGKAAAVFGTMLNIKPILSMRDGVVVPFERVRTRTKALARVGELIRSLGDIEFLGIAASDDLTGQEMTAIVRQSFPGEIEIFKLGAVIGTYAGPRATGVFANTRA